MAVNMIVSSAALIRYDARLEGVAAQTSLDKMCIRDRYAYR